MEWQVGSGSGNLASTLLCRRRRGMLGWVLLMPQCPPPPHFNYSQTSQKLGQILLPGKKKKKKNIMAMVPNKESGRHTVGKQSEELKFDTEDLLELKFGRLLGESRETTLAKVPNTVGKQTQNSIFCSKLSLGSVLTVCLSVCLSDDYAL